MDVGRELIVVYLFDVAGTLLEARIDDLGVCADVAESAAGALLQRRIAELGSLSYGDIQVRPFSVQRFGTNVRSDTATSRRR